MIYIQCFTGDGHAIFKLDNQQGPNCVAQGTLLNVAAWMGGAFAGRTDTCVCMAESLCFSPESITTLLISGTPIQNKKLKKKKTSTQSLAPSLRAPC